MKKKEKPAQELPSLEQLTAELDRVKYKKRYKRVLKSTIYTLIVVAAVAVLVATIWMPVLQIYGSSMTPTLSEGNIVVSLKGSKFELGDLVAFYLGNKILVKRCIAGAGQWVNIDEEGNVYVDGVLLDEPYVAEKALLCDGEKYEDVTLNKGNNWKYTWKDLDTNHRWTVTEKAVEGYRDPEIRQSGNTFIVTNTCNKPTEPRFPTLPQTGQLWWPVPVLIAAGLFFVLMGLLCKKGSRNER